MSHNNHAECAICIDTHHAINRKSGADAVYLASMHGGRETAPWRIPFGQPPDLKLPDHS